MNLLRSIGAIVLATVLLMPVSVLASSSPPPTVPKNLNVPAGSVLLFSRHARGVQIYECQNGGWVFHAPRAQLFDRETNRRDGVHYGGIDQGATPGPWWESADDGSRIRAGKPIGAPSPNPDSIPLLLLEVLEHKDSGMFSPVTHIQRLNTHGGVSPTGACETGARRQVPYTADYYFYAAP